MPAYYLNNDLSSLECVIDDKNKQDMFYINLPVPIRSSDALNDLRETNIVVTAINFTRALMLTLIPLNPRRMILPLNV
ncbi:hypothetical protein ACFLV0_06635 [Chloroflexota bacterium]